MDWVGTFLSRLDTYDGLADWIHTLVAILGLVITIWLASAQHHREQKSKAAQVRLRARSLAVAIFPELLELKPRIDYLARNIGYLLGDGRDRKLYDRLSQATVALPPALQRSVHAMHLLGDSAGSEVQQLVAIISQYNRMVEALRAELACGAVFADGYFPAESLRPHLEAAQVLIDKAIELVAPIQDGELSINPA